MAIHHLFPMFLYVISRPFASLGSRFNLSYKGSVRVLILHDVSGIEADLKQLLIDLKKEWNIISPLEFERMMSGDVSISGRNLLITFDDGFESNLAFAKTVLNDLNIYAIFFIITDFIGLRETADAEKFIRKNILNSDQGESFPSAWRGMDWDGLRDLVSLGHTIGSHTKSHMRLSSANQLELCQELEHSRNILESKLGVTIQHFSYPFGDISSVDRKSALKMKEVYRYVHSGIRGKNVCAGESVIYRDAIAYQSRENRYFLFRSSLIKSFIHGFGDFRYFFNRRKLNKFFFE